ncbi:peptidase inhibitor family I36 protein [Phycicoccus endophyticus]|uniref:Peptidase inhibitor family I36 protein n=1 Tax=Phycicoccus endophyticus TaxID=1690220 RepID=A0A7G9R4U8_9MICO|nr:peptidase inhibitor family I36 protein [Phycicoccus endophyticus]NHI18545.1 peptidase inhibitor family I36 protein [Phycicoccus endophyticus]QNN50623.1 peptidase inhibitor family I36 protein [Phycicoccus endophyticus]GGL22922.1 hypothetical protein GCM10012283_01280 [Phycicoccus endophyticus]
MSTTIRRLTGAGGTAVLLAAGALAGAPTASAGTPCPSNRLCFYFNSDFAGARADYRRSDATMTNELFSDGGGSGYNVVVNNNAASVRNRTGEVVYLFNRAHCTLAAGESAPGLAPGANVNLASVGLKNKVSSFLIVNKGRCIDRDQTGA